MKKLLLLCLLFCVGEAKAQQPYSPDSGTCVTAPTVTSAAANNLVLKTSSGSLCSYTVVNVTATAGFVVVLNLTAAPADGVITPLDCKSIAANGTVTVNWNNPLYLSTGITIVVTSAATCFTKTTGAITAFISGSQL
jgi:hypothetical protein